MVLASSKERFAIISRFEKMAKNSGQIKQPINKYAEQWAADALLQSYEIEQIHEIMDYYFKITAAPQWSKFIRIAGDLLLAIETKKQDDAFRKKNRMLMKEWLSES